MRSIKPRPTTFAAKLLAEWQRLDLPQSGDNIVVAVSGGSDSTALLLGLDELLVANRLHLELTVAHLDHGLRSESRADAKWVSQLAQDLGYHAVVSRANLKPNPKARSGKAGGNLEQAARKARYDFLLKTAKQTKAQFVLTGHTLDDQAETILLRLLRGSAAEGLSGTPIIRQLTARSTVKLARPFLSWARHADTEDYCHLRKIQFRADEMNDDEAFTRVRVRKQLLPLMKSFNNRIVETLSRTANLLNEDAAALAQEAAHLLGLAAHDSHKNNETGSPTLSVSVLLQSPPALRRRALREWILQARGDLKRVEMVHLVAVEKLLEDGRGGRVAELPGGMLVRRTRGLLELSAKKRLKKPRTPSKIPGGRHRRA